MMPSSLVGGEGMRFHFVWNVLSLLPREGEPTQPRKPDWTLAQGQAGSLVSSRCTPSHLSGEGTATGWLEVRLESSWEEEEG